MSHNNKATPTVGTVPDVWVINKTHIADNHNENNNKTPEGGLWFVFFIFSSLKRIKWNGIECRVSEVWVEKN